jgi:integral membrane protein (TIGR01906 family)
MNKKNIVNLFFILLVLSLISLPFLITSYILIFNGHIYKSEFTKYNVYERYSNISLDSYNKEVLDYLKGKRQSMPSEISLNEREIRHMEDVRNLFSFFINLTKILIIMVIISITILFFTSNNLLALIKKSLFYSSVISMIVMLPLITLVYFNFGAQFEIFHRLFFRPDSYLFSAEDNIVNIYPEGLFQDIFTKAVIASFIAYILILLISILLLNPKIYKYGKSVKKHKKA